MSCRTVIALLVVAGCGRNASPPPPSSTPAAPPAAPTPVAVAPAGSVAGAGSGYNIDKACTMITAAEVSGIVGFPVTAHDEGFRCKFVDAKQGWLQLELMDWASRGAHDICDYAQAKRTVVPGVGDRASYLGATACVKVGDVAIIIDGANLAEHSPALGHSGAESPYILVGKLVATRIP